jgi:nicotinate-nucleotide adenylyltransferase
MSLAKAALSGLGLERVLLVPAHEAPHKTIEADPGADVRLELCNLACEGVDGVEVSDLEVARPGPSWTVDTLRTISSEHPDWDLVLVLGEDMAASLDTWREPSEVVELATIAWVGRPGGAGGVAGDRICSLVNGLGGGDPVQLEMPPMDISSTLVRERCAIGEPVADLVPAGVDWLIAERGLYRNGGDGA